MHKFRGFILAASAVIFFAGAAAALDPLLLARNVPVKAGLKLEPEKKDAPAAQARQKQEATDFDAVSATDPLYREGSKEMLKEAVKRDEAAAVKTPQPAAAPALRDAPISKDARPVKALKKPRSKKPVHADPVKANAL